MPRSEKATTFCYFLHLPIEIQLMIIKYCIRNPACHTIKVEKDHYNGEWFPGLRLDSGRDSPYRTWKNLILAFRLARDTLKQDLDTPKVIRLGPNGTYKAVVDTASDLVMLQFKLKDTFRWSEHIPGPGCTMHISHTRSLLSNITRLSLRYKSLLPDCKDESPFKCRCSTPHSMKFKYCPQELAGFLDLFRNLEKFYFVVSCTNRVTKEWFKRYRKKVEDCHFRVDAVNRDGALEVEQYHDFKWDYMRILPNPTRNSLMRLGSTAGDIWSDVEACLSKTRGIYKSLQGDEIFITPLPIRRAVHFGLLMEWNRWSEDIL